MSPTKHAVVALLSLAGLFGGRPSSSALEVTSLRLFHGDLSNEVDFLDSSSDASRPQIFQFNFELDPSETFELLNITQDGEPVAYVDAQFDYEVFPPYDPLTARVGVNPEAGHGVLSLTSAELTSRGEWKVEITTDQTVQSIAKEFLGFKKCEEGFDLNLEVDTDACTITYGSGCPGTIYPEPAKAVVGLVSDLESGFVDSAFLAREQESEAPDGSLAYSVSGVVFGVDDSTPKSMSLMLEVLHGPDPLDVDRVVDATLAANRSNLAILDSFGCPKVHEWCDLDSEDRNGTAAPYLPSVGLDGEIDDALDCFVVSEDGLEEDAEAATYEDVPPYEAAPCRDEIRPAEADGAVVLRFTCREGCSMVWPEETMTQQRKDLECRRDSLHWEEVEAQDEEQDQVGSVVGVWPNCECSEVEASGSAAAAAPTNVVLLQGVLCVMTCLYFRR